MCLVRVAPFVGVWIEILEEVNIPTMKTVAPFVGVWIEIVHIYIHNMEFDCRSLRGSVD